MTATALARPPKPPAPGKGLAYAAVPDPEWRVAQGDSRCRRHAPASGVNACGEPAAAEKSHPADPISPWWPYCAEHARAHGRWVQDGTVLHWALRKPDGTAPTPQEAVRARSRKASRPAGECSQHHCPRSECLPGSTHNRSNRFHDEIYDRAERAAETKGATVTAWLEQAMEAVNDSVRCRRCDRRDPAAPPVPVEYGDLSGKPFGKWIAEAMALAESQHPRHEPVKVGAETVAAPPALPGAIPWRSPAVTR